MMQTWENGENSYFGPDLGPLGPIQAVTFYKSSN